MNYLLSLGSLYSKSVSMACSIAIYRVVFGWYVSQGPSDMKYTVKRHSQQANPSAKQWTYLQISSFQDNLLYTYATPSKSNATLKSIFNNTLLLLARSHRRPNRCHHSYYGCCNPAPPEDSFTLIHYPEYLSIPVQFQ